MKVILQQDIKDQGKKGQMVDVSDGYARNFLFPRKLAVEATTDTMNAMKIKEAARLRKLENDKTEARAVAAKLDSCVVKISAKAGTSGKLFGAVTAKEISDALAEQFGITIEKNRIVQDEHIKTYGPYDIKCKLGFEINGIIHVIVTEA
jgi:large subunit ribosomal protein L9